jgi:hypothetical protein
VGPRNGLDRFGKSRHPPGFDPRTAQPVASRYTDYAPGPQGGPKAGLEFGEKKSFASAVSRIVMCGLSGSQLFILLSNDCNIILHLHVFNMTSSGSKLAEGK